jgi:transglutaminase-like putative cysteine protease
MAVQTQSQSTIASQAAPASRLRPFRYIDSVYFQDGQWLMGLLAAALYLILAAALDAAGHVNNLSIVVPVTAGAFLLGILMSYSRFDGFFALSHSMFVGLAWILFMMASAVPARDISPFLDTGVSELQARVYFVLLRLLDWVDAAFSGAASGDNYVFVFEICFLMWWLTYLGAWAIFRHGYTWRAIVPAGIVLLINTYFAPNPTTGFLIAFVVVGLLLLVRTNLSEQQLRWREQSIYFSSDIVWDFLRNGLSFTVAIVVIAWILPGLGRNPQVREFLAPVNQGWENTAQNVQRLYQGLNRQEQAVGSSFGDNLTLGGERNVGDALVFEARALRARYWRAVVFDTFDGRQWRNTADAEVNFAAGEIVPVASWRAREPISQTVSLLAPVGDVLFGAADVAQANLRMRAVVRPQNGATPIPAAQAPEGSLPVEFTLIRAARDLDHGDSYSFVSAATTASIQDLENATTDYPPEVVDKFIQIPPEFSPRVTALAQELTATAATPYEKAKAIETYLRTLPYDDAISAPPAGVDPLEYFLFDIQRGYCDYYATAMAMMLRVAGVPARTASGYAEGMYDEESQSYFVTQRDAHTWVEVFFPEYGWIEFEPTAGESPLDRPLNDQDEMAVTSQQEEQQPASPLAPTPPAQQNPEDLPPQFTGEELLQQQDGSGGPPALPWWVWALALLLVLPAGGFLIWRARSTGPTAFSADLPLLLYERLQQWAQRLGLGQAAHQTPYEHSRQLVTALPETQPYVEPLTEEYVRYRFARQPAPAAPPEAADPALLETWQAVEPLFWKAWLRKLRDRMIKPKGDPYRLVGEEQQGDK